MSQRLINRSPDLQRLRDEGYDIEVRAGHLLVKDVPYVNERREIGRGVLVSALRLTNDCTDRPDTHVVYWAGEFPCSKDGVRIAPQIEHSSGESNLGDGIVVQHSFSNKPASGYADYYEKMTRYVAIISHPARAIDPSVTAQTHPITEAEQEDDSVFHYTDNATGRAGIGLFTRRLRGRRTAIVGLGGSGAYVLDFVAKTPVAEIHLFDGDELSQHNAFRAPGAASGQDLGRKLNKAEYFAEQYSKLHRHITAHPEDVGEGNIAELRHMDFVFVCIDNGDARRLIVTKLDEFGVPFIDVGMGLYMSDEGLGGLVRVTTSTPDRREPLRSNQRIPFSGDEDHNEYSRNIQIAELNALNAALAVIRWKKWCGFYADLDRELHSIYVINGNHVINEDRP
jgi:hypothetical protein